MRAFGLAPVGLDAAFGESAAARFLTALVFLPCFLRPALRGAGGADFIRKSSPAASLRSWLARVSAALRKGMVLPSFSKVATLPETEDRIRDHPAAQDLDARRGGQIVTKKRVTRSFSILRPQKCGSWAKLRPPDLRGNGLTPFWRMGTQAGIGS